MVRLSRDENVTNERVCDGETGVSHEYEARFRIPGTSQITPTPRCNGDLHHPLHSDVLSDRTEYGASPLFGRRKRLQPESALEIERLMCASIAASASFAIQLLEFANRSPVYSGATNT